MIPNPGQFNKSTSDHYYDKEGNYPDQKYYRMDGSIVGPGHKDYKEIHEKQRQKLRKDTCPHCGGSGIPLVEKDRSSLPKTIDRHQNQNFAKKEKDSPHYPRGPKAKKEVPKDWNKKAPKPKGKPNKDDDDKNPPMSGGSKVPRKPKPSPQSPGTYRPIERKVDPDFAKKHDRYRVLAI